MEKVIYMAILLVFPVMVYSQSSSLVPDQNPRYQESQAYYTTLKDSLTAWHGTTLQNTYKAYDWREVREARRKQRREWRHEENLYYAMYGGDNGYYDGYYPYSNYSYYSPNYYSPYSGYYRYGGYNRGRWGGGFHLGFGY